MWIFIKGNSIMATARKEATAIRVAKGLKGKGYMAAYAEEGLIFEDIETIWDLD